MADERLDYEPIQKVFCDAQRRDTKGHIVANCTKWLAHEDPQHVDVHSGHRWENL